MPLDIIVEDDKDKVYGKYHISDNHNYGIITRHLPSLLKRLQEDFNYIKNLAEKDKSNLTLYRNFLERILERIINIEKSLEEGANYHFCFEGKESSTCIDIKVDKNKEGEFEEKVKYINRKTSEDPNKHYIIYIYPDKGEIELKEKRRLLNFLRKFFNFFLSFYNRS